MEVSIFTAGTTKEIIIHYKKDDAEHIFDLINCESNP